MFGGSFSAAHRRHLVFPAKLSPVDTTVLSKARSCGSVDRLASFEAGQSTAHTVKQQAAKLKRVRQRVDAGEPRNTYSSIPNYSSGRFGTAMQIGTAHSDDATAVNSNGSFAATSPDIESPELAANEEFLLQTHTGHAANNKIPSTANASADLFDNAIDNSSQLFGVNTASNPLGFMAAYDSFYKQFSEFKSGSSVQDALIRSANGTLAVSDVQVVCRQRPCDAESPSLAATFESSAEENNRQSIENVGEDEAKASINQSAAFLHSFDRNRWQSSHLDDGGMEMEKSETPEDERELAAENAALFAAAKEKKLFESRRADQLDATNNANGHTHSKSKRKKYLPQQIEAAGTDEERQSEVGQKRCSDANELSEYETRGSVSAAFAKDSDEQRGSEDARKAALASLQKTDSVAKERLTEASVNGNSDLNDEDEQLDSDSTFGTLLRTQPLSKNLTQPLKIAHSQTGDGVECQARSERLAEALKEELTILIAETIDRIVNQHFRQTELAARTAANRLSTHQRTASKPMEEKQSEEVASSPLKTTNKEDSADGSLNANKSLGSQQQQKKSRVKSETSTAASVDPLAFLKHSAREHTVGNYAGNSSLLASSLSSPLLSAKTANSSFYGRNGFFDGNPLLAFGGTSVKTDGTSSHSAHSNFAASSSARTLHNHSGLMTANGGSDTASLTSSYANAAAMAAAAGFSFPSAAAAAAMAAYSASAFASGALGSKSTGSHYPMLSSAASIFPVYDASQIYARLPSSFGASVAVPSPATNAAANGDSRKSGSSQRSACLSAEKLFVSSNSNADADEEALSLVLPKKKRSKVTDTRISKLTLKTETDNFHLHNSMGKILSETNANGAASATGVATSCFTSNAFFPPTMVSHQNLLSASSNSFQQQLDDRDELESFSPVESDDFCSEDLGSYECNGLQSSTLTPMHLRKAKLMFFFTRYPSSSLLKAFFPDIRFNKNNTAQLVKWFSNFREFYYIQMEKYARQALAEGVRHADEISVGLDSEIYRVLNLHYNRNNHIQVPVNFRGVIEATLREFFRSIQVGRDAEPSWKKQIYKIIARLDDPIPEYFKSSNFLEQLE